MVRGVNEAELRFRRIVGNNLRVAREYAGRSQRDLCEKASIGQAYLSQWESGKWNIGIDNIVKIARVTGFRPHELLDLDFRRKADRDVA
ncbi:helix-turn-helix domain-containing protein [Acidisoma cladoniae]|uniref:helix-turn-helix domain-containing protein n=1 Tax=Acidisoma cladoniae TaxID=3040935 RepID=UPI00254E2972|nr:helix-turn-helix transcriptional regulator [Acidisoma sp. PAMC 29798]